MAAFGGPEGSLLEPPTCPITLDVMNEPTFCTVDGQTYERAAIEEVVRSTGESPMTRARVRLTDLHPNRAIRDATETFQRIIEQMQRERDHIIPFDELELGNVTVPGPSRKSDRDAGGAARLPSRWCAAVV